MIIIFTGIIEETGSVSRIARGSQSCRISINCSRVVDDVKLGDSIAVNGVCLTVVGFSRSHFSADVMPETFEHTTLHSLNNGNRVNLERALRAGDRLGGHMVQGHVDGMGTILERQELDIAIIFRIQSPPDLLKYIAAKGSITIDGISLTVVKVFKDSFTVSLIPHTAMITTLSQKRPGDMVNLETDIIARYLERLIKVEEAAAEIKINMNLLAENGFL